MGKKKLGDRYQVGKTLGIGSFGKVKEGTNIKTGKKVAIKIMNKETIKKQNLIATLRQEVLSLKKLPENDNVVNLLEVLESKTTVYLILELVKGGELFDKIKNEKISENKARKYFKQLIAGLDFMHKRDVCHRDLKLENLLLSENDILKISDFGLSGIHKKDNVFRTTLGSPNYVAPEVLNGNGYNGFAADIWSCGVILYALIAGFLPFDEENVQQLFQKICTADFQYPETFSDDVIDLLNEILIVDPKKRINISGIKKHKWFKKSKKSKRKDSNKELVWSINDSSNKEEIEEKKLSIPNNSNSNNNDSITPIDDDIPLSPQKMIDLSNPNNNSLTTPKHTNKLPKFNDVKAITMTAFDLIGIVSTQMLSNVFTRSLQEKSITKTYSTFPANCKHIAKILWSIQDAIDRMIDCNATLSNDLYEVNVSKHFPALPKRDIDVNIKLFKTPSDEFFVECRRHKGDIIKYQEFFEEFKANFYDSLAMHSNNINQTIKNINESNNENNHQKNMHSLTDINVKGLVSTSRLIMQKRKRHNRSKSDLTDTFNVKFKRSSKKSNDIKIRNNKICDSNSDNNINDNETDV